jgi:hypothetical protein
MPRALTPEQLAKREALKSRTTEEVYQDAVKRGLESNVAAERVAAIKAYADERNPNITEMKDKVKIAEDRAAKAEANLVPVVTERDQAQGVLCIAIQSALQGSAAKVELADLKTNFDAKISEARTELVAEAQQCEWKATRAENAATDKLREADNKVAASGWTELRATLADLIARYSVPMPDFWETPSTMPSAFWELWGWSPTKAKVYTAFKSGHKEPTEAWRQQFLRHLKATLPFVQMYAGMEPPAPIENLSEKVACMTEQAKRWNVWPEIEREFEQAQVERQAEYLRGHYAQMASLQNDSALRGEGRSPIGQAEPVSITGYTGPHDPACCCGKPGCNPIPAHLRPFEIKEEF